MAEKRAYDYSRSGNPTRDLLGAALADLEGGAGGGDHRDRHGGSHAVSAAAAGTRARWWRRTIATAAPIGCSTRCIGAVTCRSSSSNFGDAGGAARRTVAAGRDAVDRDAEQSAAATDRHRGGVAARAMRPAHWSRWTTRSCRPAWQQPLRLGADLVVHSTTKYINGHSDVVGGAVIAADQEHHEQLCWWANCLGLTGSAFDSYLTLRGLRTLYARLAVHGRNAQELAAWLTQQPQVSKVYYPGLPSHPGHEIWRNASRPASAPS